MLKIGLAILLIAHGLVHSILAIAPNPGDADAKPGAFFTTVERSWLLPQLGLDAGAIRWTGIVLVVLSTLGFILAGLGLLDILVPFSWWRSLATGSSLVSLLLLILFWHSWLIVGVVIDLVLLAVLIFTNWLPE